MTGPGYLDDSTMRRMSRRRLLQGASAAGLAAAAFGGPARTALGAPIGTPVEGATPESGGTWTIVATNEPDTLDPHKTGAAITQTILRNVCDPLISKALDGSYVPGLATDWTVSDDGLTWDFNLRSDVTFHDGTPFDANAVKVSFDRIRDPETKSAGASSALGPVSDITVSGDYSVQFTLSEPFAPLLDGLTNAGFLATLSPATIENDPDGIARKPISTGPYMVDEWRSGESITLKVNPDYKWAPEFMHQDGPAYIESLVYRIMTEDAAISAAFEAGEVNQISVPSTDVSRIKEDDRFWNVDVLRKGVVFLEFNVTKAPFDDLKLRQAINYAIDKEAVLNAAVQGLAIPAYGFLPPSIVGYWSGIEDYAPHFDKAKAEQLLDEAGWTLNGDNREKDGEQLKFTLYSLKSDSWTRGVQVVQSQLKDIGIGMDIQIFEFGTLLEKCQAGEHQVETMGYTYPIADIVYLWFDSANIGSGLNLSHIDDPDLDALISKSRTTMDADERNVVFEDLQKYIVDQAIWAPLWIDNYTWAYDNSIQGAQVHPDAYTLYFDAWLS
jgi:peptide/nickel transport system substrate-binding protein